MSNKKRISKKASSNSFLSLKNEFAMRLALLIMENSFLRQQLAIVQSQPRKPFPEGRWNPPLKKNSLIVGENCPEFIVDQFGNRKKVHLQESSEPDVLNGSLYKHIIIIPGRAAKLKYPRRELLLEKINNADIPLSMIPELTSKRIVFEKPGPGLLLIWNQHLLETFTDSELVGLLLKLDVNTGREFLGYSNPGKTHSGEAEKFLKTNIRLQTDTNDKNRLK